MVVQFANSGRRYMNENAAVFKALARDLPVVVSFIGETMERENQQDFRNAGVLPTSDPAEPAEPAASATPAALADWDQTMQFCQASGIRPAVLRQGDRAAQACAGLRLPWVVKVLPSEAGHKTELGLVKMRLGSADEVDALAADFRRKLAKPGAAVLVQEMVGDGVEMAWRWCCRACARPISARSWRSAVAAWRSNWHATAATWRCRSAGRRYWRPCAGWACGPCCRAFAANRRPMSRRC